MSKNIDEAKACSVCGTALSGVDESCPVCMLRIGLAGGVESGGSSASEDIVGRTPEQANQRFEHYELARGADGKPVVLGRGAMGVTYKALDVDLRCPVALKVISERYLGDELARLRFLREARAAAKLRHSNVASVLHLGRTGSSYFYAMEFVEGETLENLIKRSGRIEVKLALEIATQVAAGLGAVHKQKLVHRDIKPSNIMVSLEEGGAVTAKIIDLGLAKAVNEPDSQTAISMLGGFAGTPEFASPEQFAGVGVDIRSDLYSLGVTLWEMVTGHALFRGSPAEVMYQHQRAPLPVERLKDVPQPVVVLLEILLEKDPVERFRAPNVLLKVIPAVMRAVEARRTIEHKKLRVDFVEKASFRPNKLPAIRVAKRSIAVLPFASLSKDKRNTYFAEGVQDEILFNLAKVSQLKVISRTSAMTYRPGDNRNLRSIGESLGVANVVEGTVRRDGNRVRITIRLVDARTDKTLWSDSYDRDLTDIFAIQSEIAQAVASKLSAHLSPEEKKRIEAKPTDSLEAYDLYLRANGLILNTRATGLSGNVTKPLGEAILLLEQAIRLDPKFTLAYCASATANALLYHFADRTPERRASADAAMNSALHLQPDIPEVHLTYAYHLFQVYRDYERARVQLAMARRGLPNDSGAIALAACMDRRQGKWERAIENFKEAIVRDPLNAESISEFVNTLYWTREFHASQRAYDRLIELVPDQPMLKVQKAADLAGESGDTTPLQLAFAALPTSMADDIGVLSLRMKFALDGHDWKQAKELVEKMMGAGEDDGNFGYGNNPVPVGCYSILLARLQGIQPDANSSFAQTREQLNQKVQKSLGSALLLGKLGLVDALLNNKEAAISEAKRAVEILPISKDAVDGPNVAINLALVYAWTNEPDLAFEALSPLTKTPNGIYYGELKLSSYWEPLRQDPRFQTLLAEFAPKD
jgi:serine/threonine protein kinase